MNFRMKLRNKIVREMQKVVNASLINASDLVIGKGVTIEQGVSISADRLVLGDHVTIKSGTRIEMKDLVIGDYTTIHNSCLLTGTGPCRIGHNCWIGHYSVVDSIGTLRMGNNVGVGAHSQLWSHIQFGDTLEGSRFDSQKPLIIGDDVWFVGHCIVSPIVARKKSMALAGSVVTKDMAENCVYGGSPARDLTDKIGGQCAAVSDEKKKTELDKLLEAFLNVYKPRRNRIKVVNAFDASQKNYTQFSVTQRQYIKNLYPEEVQFMRFLLPKKAKFTPSPETDWIKPYLEDTRQ